MTTQRALGPERETTNDHLSTRECSPEVASEDPSRRSSDSSRATSLPRIAEGGCEPRENKRKRESARCSNASESSIAVLLERQGHQKIEDHQENLFGRQEAQALLQASISHPEERQYIGNSRIPVDGVCQTWTSGSMMVEGRELPTCRRCQVKHSRECSQDGMCSPSDASSMPCAWLPGMAKGLPIAYSQQLCQTALHHLEANWHSFLEGKKG